MSFAERYRWYSREQVQAMNDFVREYGRGFYFYPETEVKGGKVQS